METLDRYLVELHRPADGWGELQAVAARARAAADELRKEGTPVRFLRSVFVPEDDSCVFLFEATSAEAVGEAGRRAALDIERVAAALRIDGAGRAPDESPGADGDPTKKDAVKFVARRS